MSCIQPSPYIREEQLPYQQGEEEIIKTPCQGKTKHSEPQLGVIFMKFSAPCQVSLLINHSFRE
jgi:hypothetical protein